MQKLITVTIDIERLRESSKGAFTVNDVEEVNELLEEGWEIEDWEFIAGDKEAEKAVVLLMLNDELYDIKSEDPDYGQHDFEEDDPGLFNDDKDNPETAATDNMRTKHGG